MKKLPFVLLFVLVIVYLCACGAAGPAVQAAITSPPEITESCNAEGMVLLHAFETPDAATAAAYTQGS